MKTIETRETAITIIRRLQMRAPVDVYAIASALRLKFVVRDLGPSIAGSIKRLWGGRYEIAINRRDHPRRRRFTVAHEVAHYVLHRDLIGDGFDEDKMYRGPLGGDAETQANRLASDILMPYFLIHLHWDEGVRGVHDLARLFDVSSKAMEIRLEGFLRSGRVN